MKLSFDKTIYIISGTCGVGKSSVSRSLAQRYKYSSHINADLLYDMVVGGIVVPWEDDGTLLRLLWANIKSITENFIASGFTPVIDYVVFPEHLHFIREIGDKFGLKVKYAVMSADEETIKYRDSCRTPDNRMGDRAIDLLNEFKGKNIDASFIIDTSSLSIEAVKSPGEFNFPRHSYLTAAEALFITNLLI